MTKTIISIDDLVDDVIGALASHASAGDDYRLENLRIMHSLGESIAKHPSYAKGRHGQGDLFERILERVREQSKFKPSKRYLENCVTIYGIDPEVRTVCKLLEGAGKRPGSSNALVLARGEVPRPSPQCRHCPLHYPKLCP